MVQNILVRNNVKISGAGIQPILFAPGFGCDQTVWKFVAEAFEEDYKVILFDYVGLGNSDISSFDPMKYNKLSGYVQDLLDVCEALNLKDVIFVGHSVSSMIGMLASIQRPEYFSQLVMIGPSPCYLNYPPDYFGGFEEKDLIGLIDLMDKNYIGWANFFSTILMSTSAREDVTKDLEERFCSTDPVVARAFAEASFFSDNREDLPKALIPSLILQCSEDTIAPTEVGQYLNQHLPNSTLVYMNAVGHCPHMSNPEETVQCIKEFITNGSSEFSLDVVPNKHG